MNHVTLHGNAASAPEVKMTQSGKMMATFSLATNEYWKDAEGERQQLTDWHKIVCWGKTAEIAEKIIEKGKKVLLTGKVRTRSWEADDGSKRYMTEIIAQTINAYKLEKPNRAPDAEPPPGGYATPEDMKHGW